MAFSARLRMARPSISVFPFTQTGSPAPSSATSFPWESARGATNSATSGATDLRSASASGLTTKSFLEPVQAQIDRRYQGTPFARKFVGRQPHAGTGRANAGGDFGGLPKRPQSPAEDRDIRDQQD